MRAPDWLTARPVAHRGLHDIARGIVENMPAAAQAAVDGNFAIECDIQLSSDGEAMVHHDNALGRLTEGSGALLGKTAAELKAVQFKNTPERMMTLGDLCALVAGRVPLVIEVKSHFDGDRRLVKRMADVLASYDGPAVGMSFDPDQVLALRASGSRQEPLEDHLVGVARGALTLLRRAHGPGQQRQPKNVAGDPGGGCRQLIHPIGDEMRPAPEGVA